MATVAPGGSENGRYANRETALMFPIVQLLPRRFHQTVRSGSHRAAHRGHPQQRRDFGVPKAIDHRDALAVMT